MIVLSRKFREMLKSNLEEIFLYLKDENVKLKKLDIEKRRLYQNILTGLDFKIVKETISAIIKEKVLKKQIKKKNKKKTGWNLFGSKISETITEEEKLQIENLIEEIVEENKTIEDMPDSYCHTVIYFKQRELRFDLRNGNFNKILNGPIKLIVLFQVSICRSIY
jgi:hypothetical protein